MSEVSRLLQIEDNLVRGAKRLIEDEERKSRIGEGSAHRMAIAQARLQEREAAKGRVQRMYDACRLFGIKTTEEPR